MGVNRWRRCLLRGAITQTIWWPRASHKFPARLALSSINTHGLVVGAGTKICYSVYQTLFYLPPHKRKKAVWPRETTTPAQIHKNDTWKYFFLTFWFTCKLHQRVRYFTSAFSHHFCEVFTTNTEPQHTARALPYRNLSNTKICTSINAMYKCLGTKG